MIYKKTFTKYLFAFTIFLLIINLVLDLINKPSKNENINELTIHQIDSVFNFVLDEYGIDSNWIITKPLKIEDEDSISKQYIVTLPADLPIPLIIRDINNIIQKDITGFVSDEKKIFGTTEIRIYTNELLKLQASLVTDSKIIRSTNNFSFIISDAFDLGNSDYYDFLQVPYSLAAAVIPEEPASLKADSLEKYSKEYIVLINDDIKENKFKLQIDYQKELLKRSVNSIVSFFNKSQIFLIDEASKLFNSTVYNFVRDEFKRKGRTIVPFSQFVFLESNDQKELISKFIFHRDDKTGNGQKIFIITFEDFNLIRDELEKARKKGSKVIPLSATEFVKSLNQ